MAEAQDFLVHGGLVRRKRLRMRQAPEVLASPFEAGVHGLTQFLEFSASFWLGRRQHHSQIR